MMSRRQMYLKIKVQAALLTIFCCAATLPSVSRAKTLEPLTKASVSFELASQDGELHYPCSIEVIRHSHDLKVTCARKDSPNDVRSFTVHARVTRYDKTSAGQMSYELLYWVTNHRAPAGGMGKNLGTTLWFHFDNPSNLVAFEVGQDIEDVFVLRMKVKLPLPVD